MTLDLSARVAIHQGWEHPDPEPDWVGTLEEFWNANDGFTLAEMSATAQALATKGQWFLGGGSQPCFTLKVVREPDAAPVRAPNPRSVAAAERDARLCKGAGKLLDALAIAREYVADFITDCESGLDDGIYDDPEPLAAAQRHLAMIDNAVAEAGGRA